ncbi:uncharacterized protein LOC121513884 [Cheilinus undulatus]|uniref:uncharacterized protein LOC121513884 n=1 Tax=Cheilinus undulatus TaxID=241271 RepID=UPI001BD29843|nr:uncharacterized protein LOC121513884 [Cheilinus undulatus]
MTSCNISSLLLLKLMFITFLPVFEAAKIQVSPKVTGYVGHTVTLSYQFIKTDENIKIIMAEWKLKQQEEQDSTSIVVFSNEEGVSVKDTFLKDRVNVSEKSLIIRDVQMRDAGLYTCIISTFPHGSLEGTTRLVVQEQKPLSSGVMSAIVISVLLLLGILVAIVYLLFIRRDGSSARHNVFIDTNSPVRDVTKPSFIVREQDVAYSDVKHKPSRAKPSSSDRVTQSMKTDDTNFKDVVYSDVKLKPSRVTTPSSTDSLTQSVHTDDVMYSEIFVSTSRF